METDEHRYSLSEVNRFDRGAFVRMIGPVFEHSPWIAETAWAMRPFADIAALHRALCQTVTEAGEPKKLALICAHPDLVGHAALAGSLTAASTREQANAGLNRLSPEEISLFQRYNQEYREKFGFPFVICARLNKKEAILGGFDKRLKHTRAEEIAAALEEISKIAWLRLQDILAEGK